MAPAASTEAMVDAPVAPPPVPGEARPAAPSFVSGEAEDLREGFVFPLIDPWYASSLYSPLGLWIFLSLRRIGIGRCEG